jgi:NAD(P)-dependent dehydrogenase (short-subunit alcohol dehydrogenase family)
MSSSIESPDSPAAGSGSSPWPRGRAAVSDIFDLRGRVAVVTGAGRGLGRAFAETLVQAGASVAVLDIDGVAAEAVAGELRSSGGTAVGAALDVTDEFAVTDVVDQIVAEFGQVDVLVNNAGIGDPRTVPLHRVRTEDWRKVFAVNLDGTFLCSRAVLGHMVTRQSGKIINVASMFGLMGARISAIPAYAPSKGAVVNLTRELALQYAANGIQVNALCPGYVRTGLSDGIYENPTVVETLNASVPMGRIAEVAELRGGLLMLASSASDYMTGQTLVIDGGCNAG